MTGTDDPTETGDSSRGSVDLRTVGNRLGLIVLVAVVVPFVIFAVPQLVGAQQSYVVLSGSMEPAIGTGDAVIVESVDPARIEEGDVVTFGGESRTTTHRVTDVVERDGSVAFRTKGDNNEDADQALVSPGDLRGRVMTVGGHLFVIPYIGYVIQFAGTRTGYVLLVAIPLTLLVASEVWDFVAAARTRSGADDTGDGDGGATTGEAVESDGGRRVDGASGPDGADGYVLAAEDGDDEEGISFRATELELGLGVLGAFVAYSLWVAYDTTEVWAIGVAASAIVALVMMGGLYRYGGAPADEGPRRRSAADGGLDRIPIEEASPPRERFDGDRQPVAAFGTLVEMAGTLRRPIRRDPDGDRQYVVGESTLYVHEGEPGEEWDWPATSADDEEPTAEVGSDD